MEAKVEFDDGKLHACSSIPAYTKQEGEALEKLLKEEETFIAAQHTLIYWLKRGECTEENCAQFRILIQLCLDRYEKLLATKKESKEKAMKKEDDFKNIVNEMEKLFNIFDLRGIWADFSPNQVTELVKMRTDIKNLKQNIFTDAYAKQKLAEMKKEQVNLLKCKIDCLTNQLNAAEEKSKDLEKEVLKLKSILEESRKQRMAPDVAWLSYQKEAELIALLSTFLFAHPSVEVKCIYSNLKCKYPIDEKEIEYILRKYSTIFVESSQNETTKVWNCVSASLEMLAELKNRK